MEPSFWARPFAHRGLHDIAAGRAENSLSAVTAAAAAGYGVEIDVQFSADGRAMVFHDYDLDRLTVEGGKLRNRSADALQDIALTEGGGDVINTLEQVLAALAGRTPVLVELKDQDGAMGPNVGALEQAVARALSGYGGPVAVMSFNPHSMIWFRNNAPHWPRGLVSYNYLHPDEAHVDPAYRKRLAALGHFGEAAADFVSYGAISLPTQETQALRERGVPLFCWTIRSKAAAEAALRYCDQVTFEDYLPD